MQVDHERIELSAHVAEVEVQLRLAPCRERRVALGTQRLEITDVLLGLVHLLTRLLEARRRGELRRAGLVDLVRRHELPGQERLEPVEAVGRVLQLRLHALHGRPGRSDGEALALDAALGDRDLTVERRHVGPRTLERELVRARVDDDEKVTSLHALIVLHVQLGDRPAHLWHDPDDVGRHDRIVRLRMPHHTSDDHHTENDEAGHDGEADRPSQHASGIAHPSSRTG